MPIRLLSLLMRPLLCRTRQRPWLPQTREHKHMQRPCRTGQTASNSFPKDPREVAARMRPPLTAAHPTPGLKRTQVNAGGPGGTTEPPSRLFKAKWPQPLPRAESWQTCHAGDVFFNGTFYEGRVYFLPTSSPCL